MKKLFFLLIVCISCGNSSNFSIGGKLTNAPIRTRAYLYKFKNNWGMPIDSTFLSENGLFKFSHNSPEENFYKVVFEDKEYFTVVKNGDQVTITADLSDGTSCYVISGNEESEKLQLLNDKRNEFSNEVYTISSHFNGLSASKPDSNKILSEKLNVSLVERRKKFEAFILKFVNNNLTSLSGFYAMNLLNAREYENELIDYAGKIRGVFDGNAAVSSFLARMEELKTVQIGQTAPDFLLNSIEGKSVRLSQFKGKYVLLDFWASWCIPCRLENPNLVKVYKEFKNRNFEILSISLDDNDQPWRKAVQEDRLTWTHLREVKNFEGQTVKTYQIQSIPSSFVIDPSGKIIAKNLLGENLGIFLRSISK